MTDPTGAPSARVTHLIARAHRPFIADPLQRPTLPETLYVALLGQQNGSHVAAWACVAPDETGAPRTPSWNTDFAKLDLGTANSPLLATPWERIDFFRLEALDAAGGALERASPRVSLDAVADETPIASIGWTWLENRRFEVAPTERPPRGPVSERADRTCLYRLALENGRRYLVANVRLRSFLGRVEHGDRGLDVSTWQFVVPLGIADTVQPAEVWPTGDLHWRDVFCAANRPLPTGRAYSFSRDVFANQAFSMGQVVTARDAPPPSAAQRRAVSVHLGSSRRSLLARRLGGETLEVGPIEFATSFDGATGGLGFVADHQDAEKGTVRLRFYARRKTVEIEAGPFDAGNSSFLIQEQDFGNEGGTRPYQVRDVYRELVDWRLYLVDQKAIDGPKLAKWWSDEIASPLAVGLRTARDGSPLSFVPSLRPRDAGGPMPWLTALSIRDRVSNLPLWHGIAPHPGQFPDLECSTPIAQPATLDADRRFAITLDVATVAQTVPVLPARLIHRDAGPEERPPDGSWARTWTFDRARIGTDVTGVSFGLELDPDGPPTSGRVALGALDLTLVRPESTRPYRWSLFGGLRREVVAHTSGNPRAVEVPAVRIDARLPVQAAAGAVDRLSREDLADVAREAETRGGLEELAIDAAFERDLPTVIDLGSAAADQFELHVREAVFDGRSQNVAMSLYYPHAGTPGAKADRRIMVIDRTPFGVYLAKTPALVTLANPETNEVAIWSSAGEGGAHWRLAERPGGVEIQFPPQGIGEAMVKGGGHSDPDGDTPAPIDFRFTPHARLVVDPSYEDRRYGEVPWNVRRLFGYAEQRVPGSWLRGFDVELLFGLSGHAEGLDGILVAESEARLGRPPGRQADVLSWMSDRLAANGLDQDQLWRRFRSDWSRRWAQLAARLAVIETYRADGSEPLIVEGLRWRQRAGAKLRFPLLDRAAAAQAKPDIDRTFTDDGLAGGWSWGFESLNILEAVLRDARATSGFLTGFKLSALGGWGYLKASFDEDRTSVYADTAAGRTHFYSLERIGRIGVAWNRAKHVIVYQRTVAPSGQFDDQPLHLGRPLVRKVAEYVEILQPERAFPDSDAVPALRGCVVGVRFETTRIPVDSAWSQDVGEIGWKIPLWNTYAGLRQSTTYPRPHVTFLLAADPAADAAAIDARCATPEILHFYTDTRLGTGADTDRWEPVLGVDFGIGEVPEVDLDAYPGGRLEERLPAESPVPPGLREFTFGLDPAERPANLTADRTPVAVNAVLRNVTLMRAAGGAADEDAASTKVLRATEAAYAMAKRLEHDVKGALVGGASLAQGKSAALATVERAFGDTGNTLPVKIKELSASYRDFKKDLRAGKPCAAIEAAAAGAFDRWSTIAFTALDEAFREVILRVQAGEAALAETLDEPIDTIETLQAVVARAIELTKQEKQALVGLVRSTAERLQRSLITASRAIVGAERRALDGIDSFEAQLALAPEAVERLFGTAIAAIKRLEATVESADVEGGFVRAAEARAQVRSLAQQVAEALERLEGAIASRGDQLGKIFGQKLDDGTVTIAPGPLDALWELRGHVTKAARRADELFAWILAQRPLGMAAQEEIGAALAKVAGAIDDARDGVLGGIKDVNEEVKGALAGVRGQVDTVKAELDKPVNELAALVEDVAKYLESVLTEGGDTLQKRLEHTLTLGLNEAKTKLAEERARILAGDLASKTVAERLTKARAKLAAGTGELRKILLGPQGGGPTPLIPALCDATTGALVHWLDQQEAVAKEAAESLVRWAKERIDKAVDVDELRRRLDQVGDRVVGEVVAVAEEARRVIEDSPVGPVLQQPDRAIRLLRAFGDPPQLPKLDFNRAASAFVFGNPSDAIDMTPMTAWFDQVGDDLKALGIRLPTDKVLDRLLPRHLTKLDVGQLLPDFSGLKLDRLFRGLKAPAAADQGVRITHGLDKQRQRAWAEAVVDVALPSKAELFAFGPMSMTVHRAQLHAMARLEATTTGQVERRAQGKLVADWQLDFGGQMLVTFRQTTLEFREGGGVRFDLSPDRMELAPALRFLSDLARQVRYEEGGFVFQILERNGVPYGAEAFFEIALPPLQHGTTGIVGATIGAGARLIAYPDFAIEVGMHVSRQDSPFIFSVFILGGAGYVDASARYLPFRDALSADVSIGLNASAALGFAFGPISGHVAVMLGVSVEYHRRPGQRGGALGMSLNLLVLGRVDVMSIVTVDLSLLLQARYGEGGRITARGALKVSVRISRFFKINVRVTVVYDFKSGKSVTDKQTSVEQHPALARARSLANAGV